MAALTPPRQGRAWRWWAAALGVWLALAAVAAVALWQLHGVALDGQARELNLLSLAISDEIDRGLQGAEAGMLGVRAELGSSPRTVDSAEAAQLLRIRIGLMPLLRTLWLVDRDGRVVAASDDTPLPPLASFAPALDGRAAPAVALSRPFRAAGGDTPQFALAVPVAATTGQPLAWVVGALPTDTLLGAFTAALPAADARLVLVRSDGARLAGVNSTAQRLDEAVVAQRIATRPTLEVRRLGDGSLNMVSLHGVPRYGLHVLLSRPLSAVLATWRGAAELTAAAFALLLAGGAAALHLVLGANQRRRLAQEALQSQLVRASKLESLGALAGGVAHDFNNVLASIVGFGEMARDAAPADSRQAHHLDKVLQAALRGKSLVERILAFSRGGARRASVFALAPVVEEVLGLLSATLRPGIVLERALAAPGACVRGDPTQVFEAVTNLCSNAMQAMPAGGMLSISLARTHVDAPRVLSHSALAPGDYLALGVADQGSGITPEVMEHLFEPFFTTRGAESGTGLGLALVHGVVAEFGGAIDVQSRPGQGARFTLFLPECRTAADAAAPTAPAAAGGNGQRLLVIDDDAELVDMALQTLRGLGYDAEGFTDPQAALATLRAQPQRFAAVVTDEVMPGLGGTALTQALRSFAPALPVLLVSGYGGALLAQRAAAAGVTRVLTKPLQRAELADALAELLR